MKTFVKLIWNEFLLGGHYTSIGASGIAIAASVLVKKPIGLDFIVLMYCLVYFIYSIDRLQNIHNDEKNNSERSTYLNLHRKITFTYTVFCALLIIFIPLFFNKNHFLITILLLLLIGFTYSKITKPFSKKITAFKNYIVILMWSIIPLEYALYYNIGFSSTLLFFSAFLIIREVINCWYCDIKDIDQDREIGIKTFATELGREKLLLLLSNLNFLSAILLIAAIILIKLPTFSYLILIVCVYTQYYLDYAKKNKLNYFMKAFIADLEPSLYALLLAFHWIIHVK